ncbi:hypothetical protein FJZ26_02640 [Candidatus Parvarchaeota archaeon]|nr:hypothetical protein [Candidatus Parvarchaeota archaeon]
MARATGIEKRLGLIEARNRSVEIDKKWETSLTRRGFLAAFTYIAIGVYFQAIGIAQPWQNALVPAAAFMLTSLTLPIIKNLWLKYFYNG